ncbi:MAG: hypothetical protein E6R04_06285 [Spirochaetes bacterium]|nr:MAG: hypothetical protein E6R04_06285 [Spirochaetota bacterium]
MTKQQYRSVDKNSNANIAYHKCKKRIDQTKIKQTPDYDTRETILRIFNKVPSKPLKIKTEKSS